MDKRKQKTKEMEGAHLVEDVAPETLETAAAAAAAQTLEADDDQYTYDTWLLVRGFIKERGLGGVMGVQAAQLEAWIEDSS
jgi:hypothetical protein